MTASSIHARKGSKHIPSLVHLGHRIGISVGTFQASWLPNTMPISSNKAHNSSTVSGSANSPHIETISHQDPQKVCNLVNWQTLYLIFFFLSLRSYFSHKIVVPGAYSLLWLMYLYYTVTKTATLDLSGHITYMLWSVLQTFGVAARVEFDSSIWKYRSTNYKDNNRDIHDIMITYL